MNLVYVARVTDGLMLVASETSEAKKMKQDAKGLIASLGSSSPRKCSIDVDNMCFHYMIDREVVFLVLSEKQYPKRLVFVFLDELSRVFFGHVQEQRGDIQRALATVDRPNAFIQFDAIIQRLRRGT